MSIVLRSIRLYPWLVEHRLVTDRLVGDLDNGWAVVLRGIGTGLAPLVLALGFGEDMGCTSSTVPYL